ncbi:MAG: PEP-CTERM sorting domain-containing protein [Verrucomicrobia bacterium]|nr:PEP-CTERM sorting domain-containing protein [Verrucomicrobiota bacterium]MCH8512350.1 PEP-CTERM sorting domain-containing protein [Kiritimatiellia bacterium]
MTLNTPTPKTSRAMTALLVLSLLIGSHALAADREWSGGDGSWGDTGNWASGIAGSGDVAIFNGTDNNIDQAITLDGTRRVQRLDFNNLGTTTFNAGTGGILEVRPPSNPRTVVNFGVGAGAVTVNTDFSVIEESTGTRDFIFNLGDSTLNVNGQFRSTQRGQRNWEVNGGTLNLAGGMMLSHDTTTTGNTRNNFFTGNGTVILGGGIDPGANHSTLATASGFNGILRLVNTSNDMSGSNRITHNGGTIQFVDNVSPALGATNELQWNGGKIAAHGGPQSVSTNFNMNAGGSMEISGSEDLTLTGNLFTTDPGDMTLRVSNTALTNLEGAYLMNRSGSGSDINRNRTIEVDTGSTFRVDGNLTVSDPGSGITLTVQGGGILDLRNDNDYSNAGGSTTLQSGLLLANNNTGSATGTGAVFINGGTLGGNGFIEGDVTVNAGGTVNPGKSIGILTLNNDATFNDDAILSIELGAGNTSDLLDIGGALNLGNDSILNVINASFGTYTIANYGTLNGTFGSVSGLESFEDFTLDYGSGSGDSITLTVIPEPGTLMLLGIALGALAIFRRRH